MTAPNDDNALALAQRATNGKDRPHEINALTSVEERDGETMIFVGIPKRALEAAKPGTGGQRRGVGFSLNAEIDLPEGHFVLRASWMTISAR